MLRVASWAVDEESRLWGEVWGDVDGQVEVFCLDREGSFVFFSERSVPLDRSTQAHGLGVCIGFKCGLRALRPAWHPLGIKPRRGTPLKQGGISMSCARVSGDALPAARGGESRLSC